MPPKNAPPAPAPTSLTYRQCVMRCCALATDEELATAVGAFSHAEGATELRPPETGLVMLRGRTGGDGAPFNLGEATVTRAVMQLKSRETGYSYVLGRSANHARLAAILDALAQSHQNRAAPR